MISKCVPCEFVCLGAINRHCIRNLLFQMSINDSRSTSLHYVTYAVTILPCVLSLNIRDVENYLREAPHLSGLRVLSHMSTFYDGTFQGTSKDVFRCRGTYFWGEMSTLLPQLKSFNKFWYR
jgi:hypothetical protein